MVSLSVAPDLNSRTEVHRKHRAPTTVTARVTTSEKKKVYHNTQQEDVHCDGRLSTWHALT